MQIPSSLQNIYKEIHQDLGCSIPNHGHLEAWVDQGVLLLNTSLTVEVSIRSLIEVFACLPNETRDVDITTWEVFWVKEHKSNHGFDAGPQGKLAFEEGLGDIHRHSNLALESKPKRACVPFVGQACTSPQKVCRSQPTHHPRMCSSQWTFSAPRILRLQAFFEDECST